MQGRLMLLGMTFPLALAACGNSTDERVLVIEQTGTYHRDRCQRVNMAETALMTRAEAKATGATACPVCTPDTTR